MCFFSACRDVGKQTERYEKLKAEAQQASEEGMVGVVQSGIYVFFAENMKFPTALDNAANGDCTISNPCFGNVVEQEVTDDWIKVSNNTYRGPGGSTYTYSSSDGSFK